MIFLKFKFLQNIDIDTREVISESILAFILKLFSAALAFSFNIIIARTLGAKEVGLYFLSLSIVMVAITIGSFGLNNSVLRFVASMSAEKNWIAVKGVFNKALLIIFCCSLFITLILIIIAPYLAVNVFSSPELASLLRWMALAIMPFCIAQIYAHGLKGLKLLRPALIVEGISISLVSILCVIAFAPIFGSLGIAWAYVVATCLTALLGMNYWQQFNSALDEITGYFATKQLLTSCLPLFWTTLFYLISNQSATFFLGIWRSPEEIAVFNVAMRCAGLISFVLVSVNQVVAPRFSALYQQGDMLALGKIARKSTLMMTLFASPLLLLMVFFPEWIMGLFGAEFKQGSLILVILALGQFVNVATGSVGFLLMMTGYEKPLAQITLLNTLFGSIVLVVLIQFHGIIGAAIATSISIILQNFLMAWVVKGKLDINTFFKI